MKSEFEIQNLKCGGCAHTIKTKINQLKGIDNIEVDVEINKVSFEHQEEYDLSKVQNLLLKLGYPVADSENSLTSKIKSYGSCAIGKITK